MEKEALPLYIRDTGTKLSFKFISMEIILRIRLRLQMETYKMILDYKRLIWYLRGQIEMYIVQLYIYPLNNIIFPVERQTENLTSSYNRLRSYFPSLDFDR